MTLAALFLRALHCIYSFIILCRSFWAKSSQHSPQPPRHGLPKHLAILLASDGCSDDPELQSTMLQTVISVVGWCRAAGIQHLTVYEEHGALLKFSQQIRDAFPSTSEELSSDSDIDYPLTPPPSDYSESRPISPQHNHTVTIRISDAETQPSSSRKGIIKRKSSAAIARARQQQLTLNLISRESSKPAIAAVAHSLASQMKQKSRKGAKLIKSDPYTLSVNELANILEFHDSPSSPDFMIVHPLNSSRDFSSPLELYGYPPWQIRLTEIYHNTAKDSSIAATRAPASTSAPLSEATFNQALDEYAAAEMRFGK